MISLIDIIGHINRQGEPIGHGLKILRDMSDILEEKVEVLAAKEYMHTFGKEGSELPFSNYSSITKNFFWRVLFNYFISLFRARGSILVYTNVCEELLYGISLFKATRKIIIISFENWDLHIKDMERRDFISRFLIRRGLKRLDGCIVTNLHYKPPVPYIRIPDYYITQEVKEYEKIKKKFGCVCLGEVRYGKDVIGLVKVMRKQEIPLLIVGSFQNRETFRAVKSYQTDNISVENKNLTYHVYMDYLSRYKYLVLPYDEKFYNGRTSGVLLEGIFVGAIPIAPESLLRQNRIQGLGYREISEIPSLIQAYENGEIIIHNNLEHYQMKYVKRKITRFLKQVKG